MTYVIDDTDMENLRDAAIALEHVMAQRGVQAFMTEDEKARLQQARDLIGVTLSRAGRNAVGEEDDPVCVCGVHRSEHALCGCPDGFERRPS